jgi:uncharacterized damage-inducible protein DinB
MQEDCDAPIHGQTVDSRRCVLCDCCDGCSAGQARRQAGGRYQRGSRNTLEFLDEVAYYEQRFTRLADAIPADKFSWRPAEGVRSIGEVYMHVVAANYGIANALGTPIPAGIDPKALIASANDKAKVVQGLKDSFAHMREAVLAIKDSDLDKTQKLFNRQTTIHGAFIMITGHYGEHLGQSIAYARQVGIVPP